MGLPSTGDLEIYFHAYAADRRAWVASRSVTVGPDGVVDLGEVIVRAPASAFATDRMKATALRTYVPIGTAAAHQATVAAVGPAGVSDAALVVTVPGGLRPPIAGVTVDGDVVEVEVLEEGRWQVPLGDIGPLESRTVRYHVDTSGFDPGTSLVTSVEAVGAQFDEPVSTFVGRTRITVGGVTLQAPGSTGQRTIPVEGYAPAASDVEIREGETVLGVATANEFGSWGTTVTLPDAGLTSRHELRP